MMTADKDSLQNSICNRAVNKLQHSVSGYRKTSERSLFLLGVYQIATLIIQPNTNRIQIVQMMLFCLIIQLKLTIAKFHFHHTDVYCVYYYQTRTTVASLPSNRHHRSCGDRLEGKGENYQVCSVQYCVQQLCTV